VTHLPQVVMAAEDQILIQHGHQQQHQVKMVITHQAAAVGELVIVD